MDFDYNKLRVVRHDKGFTIQALADSCGVSPSLISQIERGKVTPTLTTFWKMCQALNLPMHYFFEQHSNENLVVRSNQRKVLTFPNSRVQYQLLSPHLKGQLEFLLVEIVPGDTHDPEELLSHKGEECGYVLEGELLIRLGTQELHLKQGDSICFPCSTPHRLVNPGDVVSKSIWAMTPPSF